MHSCPPGQAPLWFNPRPRRCGRRGQADKSGLGACVRMWGGAAAAAAVRGVRASGNDAACMAASSRRCAHHAPIQLVGLQVYKFAAMGMTRRPSRKHASAAHVCGRGGGASIAALRAPRCGVCPCARPHIQQQAPRASYMREEARSIWTPLGWGQQSFGGTATVAPIHCMAHTHPLHGAQTATQHSLLVRHK